MSQILFALLGIFGKVGSYLITNWLESKKEKDRYDHEFKLAALKAENTPHESGFDDAHDYTRVTRRLVALLFSFTTCVLAVFCVVNSGESFEIPIGRTGGIFDWLLGTKDQSTITITLGWFAMRFIDLAFLVAGFYFTPVGSQSSTKN